MFFAHTRRTFITPCRCIPSVILVAGRHIPDVSPGFPQVSPRMKRNDHRSPGSAAILGGIIAAHLNTLPSAGGKLGGQSIECFVKLHTSLTEWRLVKEKWF